MKSNDALKREAAAILWKHGWSKEEIAKIVGQEYSANSDYPCRSMVRIWKPK